MNKLFDWLLKSRIGFALWSLSVGVLFSVVFGLLLALIGGDLDRSLRMIWIVYLFFGAPTGVSAIIVLMFPKLSGKSFSFGCGIYYGGLFLSKILDVIDTDDHIISGFICAILICVVVYNVTIKELEK